MNYKKPDNDSHPLSLTTGDISRRDFLCLASVATAALAFPRDAMSQPWVQSAASHFPLTQLAGTHDLVSLPLWGPYSKKHFGISHIPNVHRGLSFDLSLFPVSPHLQVRLPSVTSRNSGVHPWEAAPNLEYYSFRFETLWKDRIYSDISFSTIDVNKRLIRMELVNQTAEPQEMVIHSLAQMCFPPLQELTAEPIQLYAAHLPSGAMWISALDYANLQFARPRPTDNLVPDGKWRGEERRHHTVGGSVIAQNFGMDAGDRVHYRIHIDHDFSDAVLIWRYSLEPEKQVIFQMDGAVSRSITFAGTDLFTTITIPLAKLKAGTHDLHFISSGGASPALNGFVIVESGQAEQVQFFPQPWHPVPHIQSAANGHALILKYEDVPDHYGFSLQTPFAGHDLLHWRDLHARFHCELDPDTKSRIFGTHAHPGDPGSLFIHTWSRPVTVSAHSTQVIWGLACTGTEEEVRQSLENFHHEDQTNRRTFAATRKSAFQPASQSDTSSYDLSQQLMAATTCTNLVYPLYTQGNYIRSYSPGKIWDCLYTWDAGFIGLGLLELDPRCALDSLNAYTTPAGAQSAFIHHGTPLPVQIYLYYELWNRTHSREMLTYFYPRLRQYHRFMAGRLGSSTTRQHQDHLICTWDYFYNSGGWDDYPPQKFVHQQNLTSSVAPTVNSSHTIRCARLLRRVAEELGHAQDFAEYDADIFVFSSSLQKYSWDPDSGYYGYVMHDQAGKPTGILRTPSGVNFNMGLDGVSPLIAGICSPQQTQQILNHLFSSQRMWTDQGITTVDQTAPYYSPDGYWNGSVWFAHQWFLWKTMLDLGRGDLAIRIAQTGLNTWKKVTDASYNCMEHFVPHPPYGEGWVQFSSLSSPALSWFAALHTPGRLTCGFDVWMQNCQYYQDQRQIRATLQYLGNTTHPQFSVLACMHPAAHYAVLWNGTAVNYTQAENGLLHIQIPTGNKSGELLITVE